jgi:hypothetical protein
VRSAARKHFKNLFVCWLITYVVMTAWLFRAITGEHMDSPLVGNLILAAVFYALWLTARYYWRKHNMDNHPVVRDVARWVTERVEEV